MDPETATSPFAAHAGKYKKAHLLQTRGSGGALSPVVPTHCRGAGGLEATGGAATSPRTMGQGFNLLSLPHDHDANSCPRCHRHERQFQSMNKRPHRSISASKSLESIATHETNDLYIVHLSDKRYPTPN